MKTIGVKLTRSEQKKINGGNPQCGGWSIPEEAADSDGNACWKKTRICVYGNVGWTETNYMHG